MRYAVPIAVTLLFALAARLLRAVDTAGAAMGAVLALALYLAGGPGAFLSLVAVFVLAATTTRLGYRRKRLLGTAERGHGRSASQVFANVGVAAIVAAAALLSGRGFLLAASAAALAEAAADTVSSELGQAATDRAYLITSFRRVPAGTDGGVSLPGTAAGIAAAIVVALAAAVTGFIPPTAVALVAAAAILGMFLDSLLGATLERRRLLDNDGVNFLSTLFAAAAASLPAGI